MSVNKSHSKKAIISMCVSVLCLPAVSMIAGCSCTHSRDRASSLLHGLVAGEEAASDACGECRSGKDCTRQEQVRLSARKLHDHKSTFELLHLLPHVAGWVVFLIVMWNRVAHAMNCSTTYWQWLLMSVHDSHTALFIYFIYISQNCTVVRRCDFIFFPKMSSIFLNSKFLFTPSWERSSISIILCVQYT